MKKELDSGVPLKRILLNDHKNITKAHYYAVGILLKDFCDQLPRPVFGFQACGRLIETYEKHLPSEQTLTIFIGIFSEMRTVNIRILLHFIDYTNSILFSSVKYLLKLYLIYLFLYQCQKELIFAIYLQEQGYLDILKVKKQLLQKILQHLKKH